MSIIHVHQTVILFSDVHLFSDSDMIRTSIAFTWPANIEPIFLANALLIEKSQREKQDALKEKREKLMVRRKLYRDK